jgi:hypothetical protein
MCKSIQEHLKKFPYSALDFNGKYTPLFYVCMKDRLNVIGRDKVKVMLVGSTSMPSINPLVLKKISYKLTTVIASKVDKAVMYLEDEGYEVYPSSYIEVFALNGDGSFTLYARKANEIGIIKEKLEDIC